MLCQVTASTTLPPRTSRSSACATAVSPPSAVSALRCLTLCTSVLFLLGSLLRSWSLSTGDLQWEVSLTKVSDGTLALRSAALELALDPASGLVVALQDNCVNYISMTTGEIGWFWCPSDDAVILSHLVGPFTPAAKPIRRTAVACRVEAPEGYSGDAALLPCTTLSVLTVSLPVRPGMDKHAMEVWELPDVDLAGTAVRAADLRSAFAATSFDSVAAAAKLNGEDVIFAAMSDEERDVIHAVSLRARVAAEWVFAASSPAVVTAWSVVWTDTSAPRPVVSFCRSGGHNQCDLYALGIGGTAPTKVVSCGPADAPDGYIAGTAVVATGRQATHPWNQMWTVGCSVVMHAKSSGTAAQVVSKAVNASGAVVTAVADIPSDNHGQPVAASLQASHLQLFSTKADAKQSVRSLFVGAGVGSVFFTQGSRAVWNREEGLSQIRQVLMIPRPQGGDEETAKGDAEVSSKALLSFSARLKMQYADLLKTLENVSRWGSLHGRLAVLHILDASSRRAALYRMTKSIGLPLSFLAPSDVSAEKGGNSYLHALEKAAEREARDGVGKQFGFDKVAVVLSYASGSDSGGDSAVEDARVVSAASFLEDAALRRMGAKVMALDLIHGDTVWSTELNLESVASHVAARRLAAGAQGGDADRVQILVKLLPGSTHRDESSAAGLAEGVGASLVAVSVRYLPPNGAASAADDVLTCVWHIDVHSGAIYNSVDSPRNGQPSVCLPVGPGAVVGATLVDRSAAAQLMHTVEEAAELAASDRVIGGVFTHLLLRHDDKTVSAYPPAKACVTASAEGVTQYVHAFESEQGALVTYKLQREGRVVHAQGCPAANRDDIICPEYVTYSLGAVGSVLTGTTVGNRVVAVAYPTPHDKVTSRAYVLGDKSLLLKYLNPNLVVVVTECFESQLSSAENIVEVGEENAGVSHLVVSALDTVTGRVIYRYEIAHGGPVSPALDRGHSVHAEIVEHAIVVTYWNYKAQRTELSSLMLYEVFQSYVWLFRHSYSYYYIFTSRAWFPRTVWVP